MNYGLIKINTTDSNYEIFSTTIGSVYTYDNSKTYLTVGGRGFPLITQINGDFSAVQSGDTYAIVSYDDIDIAPSFFSFEVTKMTLVYATDVSDDTMKSYFDFTTIDQNMISSWAAVIGDKDYLSQFVTDERFFVNWVKYINPVDHDKFMNLMTSEEIFAEWGVEIGDRDFCRPYIVSDPFVFYWAVNIEDERPAMKEKITTQEYADVWNNQFPDDLITVLASPTPTPSVTPEITPTPSEP